MKNLAIIPARSGSQRIPHKNIKLLAGHPLMYYQIECAKQVQEIDTVVVATDHEWYADIARSFGAEVVMRPAAISGSHSKTEETLLFVIDYYAQRGEHFDNVVLLQITSPLNQPEYVRQGLELMESGEWKSVLTYVDFYGFLLNDRDLLTRPMTQDKQPQKLETGCFWITNVAALKATNNRICEPCAMLCIPHVANYEIDTREDFLIAEALLSPRIRAEEGRYFTKRIQEKPEEDYYLPKTDPDGNERDLMQERQRRIDFAKDEIRFLNELAQDGKTRTLLDVGCGAGYVSSAISDRYEKFGLEVSPIAAQSAAQFIPSVHVGELEAGLYPDEFFDAVLCHHVIEHVADPIRFLAIIHAAMKTHGHLLIGTPNFDGAMARRFGEKFRLLHDREHISLFSDFSLKQLLEDVGFWVERIEYPYFDTEYFTQEHLLRVFDTSKVSPPFYGNIFTIYARKK